MKLKAVSYFGEKQIKPNEYEIHSISIDRIVNGVYLRTEMNK